jgi:hypothetical protein
LGIARYLTGLACGAVAFVPLYFGIRALRRRYFAYLTAPDAVLVEVTVFLGVVLLEAELLGSVGLFRLPALVIAYAGTGVALLLYLRTTAEETPAAAERPSSYPRAPRTDQLVACVAVAVVAGQWAVRTVDSMRRGMVATADTVWYHMPVAARFVETGWTSHLHYVDDSSLTAFYPSASELPHAIGIAFMRSDVVSPLVNLAWLAMALLAGWSVGARFGVAPVTLLGTAIMVALPEIWLDNAGSAYNDVVGIALLLTTLALLLQLEPTAGERGWRSPLLLCAGLAAGLSLGTKFTLLPPIGVLTVALVIVAARGARRRVTAVWIGGVALGGAYWYLRNAIVVGNPLPTLKLGIGPIHLPHVPYDLAEPISDHLFDGSAWRDYFLPGLSHAFGPAWWAVVFISVAGFVLGVVSTSDRIVKAAAVTGAVSFVAYIVTPQSLGYGANLFGFEVNVRYFVSALVLGTSVLPIAATRFGRRGTKAVLVAYGAIFVATQFDKTIWPNAQPPLIANPTVGHMPRVVGVTVAVLLLVGGIVLWARHFRLPRTAPRAAVVTGAVVLVVALVVGGYAITDNYQRHRYTTGPLPANVSRWARQIHDARIAVVGTVLQYPLYGTDITNRVQYVAKRGPDHDSAPFTDCAGWRRALNSGRYDYVVVASKNFPFPFGANRRVAEAEWTRDPAVRVVTTTSLHNGARIIVFALDGPLDPSSCPA